MTDYAQQVLVILGTRPEAIKLAPVIKAMSKRPNLRPIVVTTGQHRTMVTQVTRLFDIIPDFELDVFQANQELNSLSSRLLHKLDPILMKVRPSAVLVQGDTTSACIAAIAAFNRSIPIIHLESGLRSWSLESPFPEEGNRKMISQIASLHLCPTPNAQQNLLRENVPARSTVVTGNTVIDALRSVPKSEPWEIDFRLQDALSSGSRILLVTAHRRENWGRPLVNIARALHEIALKYPQDIVVIPLHGNPMIREILDPHLRDLGNVIFLPYLSYDQFATLLENCYLVLTDSGGLQEEAPFFGKPVLVMRSNTERIEALEAGTVRLVGHEVLDIVSSVSKLYGSRSAYLNMVRDVYPYGDGHASIKCIYAIEDLLASGDQRFPIPVIDASETPKAKR